MRKARGAKRRASLPSTPTRRAVSLCVLIHMSDITTAPIRYRDSNNSAWRRSCASMSASSTFLTRTQLLSRRVSSITTSKCHNHLQKFPSLRPNKSVVLSCTLFKMFLFVFSSVSCKRESLINACFLTNGYLELTLCLLSLSLNHSLAQC